MMKEKIVLLVRESSKDKIFNNSYDCIKLSIK